MELIGQRNGVFWLAARTLRELMARGELGDWSKDWWIVLNVDPTPAEAAAAEAAAEATAIKAAAAGKWVGTVAESDTEGSKLAGSSASAAAADGDAAKAASQQQQHDSYMAGVATALARITVHSQFSPSKQAPSSMQQHNAAAEPATCSQASDGAATKAAAAFFDAVAAAPAAARLAVSDALSKLLAELLPTAAVVLPELEAQLEQQVAAAVRDWEDAAAGDDTAAAYLQALAEAAGNGAVESAAAAAEALAVIKAILRVSFLEAPPVLRYGDNFVQLPLHALEGGATAVMLMAAEAAAAVAAAKHISFRQLTMPRLYGCSWYAPKGFVGLLPPIYIGRPGGKGIIMVELPFWLFADDLQAGLAWRRGCTLSARPMTVLIGKDNSTFGHMTCETGGITHAPLVDARSMPVYAPTEPQWLALEAAPELGASPELLADVPTTTRSGFGIL